MTAGLPPATAYHRRPMRVLNGLIRVCNRVGLARVKMDEKTLIRSAQKQTGLKDFGDESFMVPMLILLK
jgi:hypothetical protein